MSELSKMPARIWAGRFGGWNNRNGVFDGDVDYVRGDITNALAESLSEIRDMLWARPDIVEKLRPLMGFAEQKISDRAAAALSAWEASNPARQASNGDRNAGEMGE